MIKKGANVNAFDDANNTALMYAAESGQVHLTNVLLSMQTDVNAMNGHGDTALIQATKKNHKAVVQILL